MNKPIVAIMYDFDKTLSTEDMQDYAFIPSLGMTPDEFWGGTGVFQEKTGVERILSYMYFMILAAKEKGIKITKQFLNDCGKNIKFYPGVETWFERINKFGEEHGVIVEHYLVSSGTKEIVEGSKIFPFFTKAWGCEYYFNDDGEPVWPKRAINYTQKTQFFFRIAKGINNDSDDDAVNAKNSELRIPYENIIYCGDGMTDIACMTLVHKNRGTSIALYSDEKSKGKVEEILYGKRCDVIAKSDYSEGSEIDRVVKLIIQKAGVFYNEHTLEKH